MKQKVFNFIFDKINENKEDFLKGLIEKYFSKVDVKSETFKKLLPFTPLIVEALVFVFKNKLKLHPILLVPTLLLFIRNLVKTYNENKSDKDKVDESVLDKFSSDKTDTEVVEPKKAKTTAKMKTSKQNKTVRKKGD